MKLDQPRRRFGWATAAVAGSGTAAYYLLDSPSAAIVWDATIASLLVMMTVAIWRFGAGRRGPWIAVWLGLMAAFAGGLLAMNPVLATVRSAVPWLSDVLRLANYPFGAAGVLLMLFRQNRQVGWRALLEAILLVGSGSVVIWFAVLGPVVAGGDLASTAGLVGLLYPLMDLVLLAVLVAAVMVLDRRPGPVILIIMALAGNLAANVAFGAQSLRGGFEPGSIIDLGWLLCFAAFAVAPAWPVAATPVAIVDGDGTLDWWRMIVVSFAALLVPFLSAVLASEGVASNRFLAVSGIILMVLALIRMAVLNADLDQGRQLASDLAAELEQNNERLRHARSGQRQLLDRVHLLIEQERTMIAANLHDRPIQNLTGVGYQLEKLAMMLDRGQVEDAAVVANSAAEELATQLGELRGLMTDIRPPVLDAAGIAGAISDLASATAARQPGLSIDVNAQIDRVDPNLETAVYRLCEELLRNVVRHSGATHVAIEIEVEDETLRLACADNGTGFDPSAIDSFAGRGHFGLVGMRERIELLGGVMSVNSEPSGTRVAFTAPVKAVPQPFSGRSMEAAA